MALQFAPGAVLRSNVIAGLDCNRIRRKVSSGRSPPNCNRSASAVLVTAANMSRTSASVHAPAVVTPCRDNPHSGHSALIPKPRVPAGTLGATNSRPPRSQPRESCTWEFRISSGNSRPFALRDPRPTRAPRGCANSASFSWEACGKLMDRAPSCRSSMSMSARSHCTRLKVLKTPKSPITHSIRKIKSG